MTDKTVIMMPEQLSGWRDQLGKVHASQNEALVVNKRYALAYFVEKNLGRGELTSEDVTNFIIGHAKEIKEYIA